MRENINKTVLGEYEIVIVRSIEEIEKLRSFWQKMQWHPNADIDLYLLMLTIKKEILQPCLFILSKKQIPVTVLIGRIDEQRILYKIGYKTLFAPKVRQLSLIYGGFMGERLDIHVDILVSEVTAFLRKCQADVAFFNSLDVDSDIYLSVRKKTKTICRDYMPVSKLHWTMKMPRNIDEFLVRFKNKHRSELRRTFRLLKKENAERVEIRCLHQINDIEYICAAAEEIMKNTYQRAMGVGFINNNEHQKRLTLSASKGWLRSYFLYVDKKPSALWIGSIYKDTFFLEFTGFDPQYRKYEPGTLLLLHVIEDLCGGKVTKIDFGFGDALYKQRFGDTSWRESSIYIYAPTIRSILINVTKSLFTIASKYTEQTLNRFNLVTKIKRLWRDQLINNSTGDIK